MKLVYDCSVTSLRRRPKSEPVRSLDFAAQTYTASGVSKSFSDVLTLSRASTGYSVAASGLLVSQAANTTRFDYAPTTGAPLGLLKEAAATNLLLNSTNFSAPVWGSAAIAMTSGQSAPDGSLTAFKLSPTATSGLHRIWQGVVRHCRSKIYAIRLAEGGGVALRLC